MKWTPPAASRAFSPGGARADARRVRRGGLRVDLCVILICVFLFGNAIPTLREIGLLNFLSGTTWRPGNDIYGILPMILGSIYVTAGALVVGVPIALLTSIFMARFCPKRILRPLTAAVNLLAGIPSVVYGFFGLTVMVPMVREHLGGNGNSMLTASLLLGMMILPTIIGVALSSIRAVPESYYEGSLALGASHERSVFFVVFPAASPRHGRRHPRRWPRHRRNDGRHHGRRQPAAHAQRYP